MHTSLTSRTLSLVRWSGRGRAGGSAPVAPKPLLPILCRPVSARGLAHTSPRTSIYLLGVQRPGWPFPILEIRRGGAYIPICHGDMHLPSHQSQRCLATTLQETDI